MKFLCLSGNHCESLFENQKLIKRLSVSDFEKFKIKKIPHGILLYKLSFVSYHHYVLHSQTKFILCKSCGGWI